MRVNTTDVTGPRITPVGVSALVWLGMSYLAYAIEPVHWFDCILGHRITKLLTGVTVQQQE
jgi:hypothetical protein